MIYMYVIEKMSIKCIDTYVFYCCYDRIIIDIINLWYIYSYIESCKDDIQD